MKLWMGVWLTCFCVWVQVPVWAQQGEDLFEENCASCHVGPSGPDSRAPELDVLRQMSPEQILSILEGGVMFVQGRALSPAERRATAEFAAGKPFGPVPAHSMPDTAFCPNPDPSPWNPSGQPSWNGWGVSLSNTRFQPAEAAGLATEQVPRLKLKWAFGFPGDYSSGATQPVVMGDRIFVGSFARKVFSLDAKTGCVYWLIDTDSGVRGAVILGEGSNDRFVVYFGDQQANVYAADAATGKLLWKVKVDDHADACITGSPVLHGGRLYVPVSSREEGRAVLPEYECCTFRGSLVALDAATGRELWKTYMTDEPRPTRKSPLGTQFWGPSGVGIWVSPTIDLKRNLIYVGTGNSYTDPEAETSDALVAFNMDSGKIEWIRQILAGDVWHLGCVQRNSEELNCPDEEGPDYDFSGSPILVRLKEDRWILIGVQKSGLVALDPDQEGEILWEQRGETEPLRTMWGVAADDKNVYVAVSRSSGTGMRGDSTGGIFAFDLNDGSKVWFTASPPCGDRKPCRQAQLAAVTAIPGVVFSGAVDGTLRAYSTQDGRILWEYATAREYATVNHVNARGGSLNAAGPTVVDGMLFLTSGYTRVGSALPGNVLLAFAPDQQ